MTYCAVKGCHNASHNQNKESKITFHTFPSDPVIAAKWTAKIRLNRKEVCWKPTKYTKICSVHFDDEEKYITKGGFCKLNLGTIPTKGLHICCMEETQDNNDNFYNPHHHDKANQDALSNDHKNHNVETQTTLSHPNQKINGNEAGASEESISQELDMDLDCIDDTPTQIGLRKQLVKTTTLLRKHTRKIRSLQQKARRLQKKNLFLQNILINLQKKGIIDIDIENVLSENELEA